VSEATTSVDLEANPKHGETLKGFSSDEPTAQLLQPIQVMDREARGSAGRSERGPHKVIACSYWPSRGTVACHVLLRMVLPFSMSSRWYCT
jgi:hypothetical protein